MVRLTAAAGFVFAVSIAPWTIRNYVVFETFIPLRSNFGLELWLGNNPQVPDTWSWWLHPNKDHAEALRYAEMTEVPYMKEKQQEAWAFIRSHPLDTARFSFRRFVNYWLGVWDQVTDLWPTAPWYGKALLIGSCLFTLLSWIGTLFAYRTRNPFAGPLVLVMFIFPLIFYVTHANLRYRFPMDPIMAVLAVFAVACLLSQTRSAATSHDQAPTPREAEDIPEKVLSLVRFR
jgi:hypothetical protein